MKDYNFEFDFENGYVIDICVSASANGSLVSNEEKRGIEK